MLEIKYGAPCSLTIWKADKSNQYLNERVTEKKKVDSDIERCFFK